MLVHLYYHSSNNLYDAEVKFDWTRNQSCYGGARTTISLRLDGKKCERNLLQSFDGAVVGESRPAGCGGAIRNYNGGFPAAFSAKGIQWT